MVYAAHILSKHSFYFGIGVCLPLLIFIYFGHVKLNPHWVQPRILEAEFIGIADESLENRLFLSGVQANFLNGDKLFLKTNFSYDNLKKSQLYRSFIENGLRFKPVVFNPSTDVLVLLHIQKTGGSSFGRLLALDIVNLTCNRLESGRKQHDCSVAFNEPPSDLPSDSEKRAIWMFSRFSVGWACGLHADWTELQSCVEKVLNSRESFNRTRRYYYITMLREPVSRYVSEWRHIARGATWAGAELRCNGRQASLAEVPFCYEGSNWRGVTLSEFLNCEHNLANNRQTRMLADLTKVNCYNKTGMHPSLRSEIMLRSALKNLASFSFIGLSDYQKLTQRLFEQTFTNLYFRVNMTQRETKAERFLPTLTSLDLHEVRRVNSLDVILYDFAKSLFYERLAAFDKHYGGSVLENQNFLENSEFDDDDEDDDYRR